MPVQIAPRRREREKEKENAVEMGTATLSRVAHTQHECTYRGLRISPSSSGEAEQWRTELLRSEVEETREAARPAQTQMERGGAISKSEKGEEETLSLYHPT